MRKLRLAVVGAGRLGGFHAQKLAAMNNIDLVAVADPVAAQRNRVAQECQTQAVADHRQIIKQVDAVVIAAPTRFHHALGMDFLGHGIHTLMEKPLAARRAHADELVDVARRHGAVLQVGHVERFNPALAAALPYVPNPKYIEAVRASGFTFRSTDIGVVLDLMIHDLDVVLSMVRSPVSKVDALGLSVLGGHEDVANVRIEFDSGCVASLSASRVSHQPSRWMQIWAPRGMAAIDFASRKTRVVRPSEALLRRRFDVDSLSPDEVEHYKDHLLEEHLPRKEMQSDAVDALTLELEDFADSIRTSRSPRVSGEQGRDAVAVAEQILTKIGTHAWDDVPGGLVGPSATPRPSVIPAPHFDLSALAPHPQRKEAG